MSPKYQRLRSRPLVMIALLLACVAALVVVAARRPPDDAVQFPRAELLDSSYKIPRQSVPFFYKYVPTTPGWGWFWRLKGFVTGRVKPVNLSVTVFTLASAPAEPGTGILLPKTELTPTDGKEIWSHDRSGIEFQAGVLPLKPELTGTNGPEIWILDAPALKVFNGRLGIGPQQSKMAITTGDGMQATVQCGTTFSLPNGPMFSGVSIDALPRIRGDRVDLIALSAQTEVETNLTSAAARAASVAGLLLRTNFAVAARMQITNGGAAFILDGPRSDGRQMGFLISATLPATHKK